MGLEELIEFRVGRKLLEFVEKLLRLAFFPSRVESLGPLLKGLPRQEIAIDMYGQ